MLWNKNCLLIKKERYMSKIILICGLPGSGKTTLANKIFQKLENSEVYNGDSVRKKWVLNS